MTTLRTISVLVIPAEHNRYKHSQTGGAGLLTFNDEFRVRLRRFPSSRGQLHLTAVDYAGQVEEDSLDTEIKEG